MNKKAKPIIVITVAAIFGITTLAFAGWGRGYGHMMGGGDWGPGYHHRGGYGSDQGGYYGNLSEWLCKVSEPGLFALESDSWNMKLLSV